MRRILLIAVALAGGCKAKRKAVPPPADAEVADAEPVEIEQMVDAVAAGAIEVTLLQQAGSRLAGNVLYVDEVVTTTKLVIENRDEDATIALPRYVLARLPGYVYPYAPEGCLPPDPWLVALPEEPVAIAAGERAELAVAAMWYLGNAQRPPPSSGDAWQLAVTEAPDDGHFARLADAVADDPVVSRVAFAVAGGCTPEPWLTDTTLASVAGSAIGDAERALAAAGFDPARSPVFVAARTHRRDTIAKLRAELPAFEASHSLEGLQILYAASDPAFAAFFHGDVEVAELVARYGDATLLQDLRARLTAALPP